MAWNFCPYCSHRVFQHTATGCRHVDTTRHIVRISDDGSWTLKHPMAEREADRLFDCIIHNDLNRPDMGMPSPGEWAIVENANGGWSFEPASKGRTLCDCTHGLAEMRG